jgi:hypothetical protein
MSRITIRPFQAIDQHAARALILEGLGGHFGFVDETCNPDLDDIMAYYLARGAAFVIAEQGSNLIGTGALITEDERTGRIVRMSGRSEVRRQGIGSAVLTASW